jgi:anthranilate phosphoribosyltransferase
VFAGELGAARDISLLNAGATIYVGGLAGDVAEGIGKAAEAVDSGAAGTLLQALIKKTSQLAS